MPGATFAQMNDGLAMIEAMALFLLKAFSMVGEFDSQH